MAVSIPTAACCPTAGFSYFLFKNTHRFLRHSWRSFICIGALRRTHILVSRDALDREVFFRLRASLSNSKYFDR